MAGAAALVVVLVALGVADRDRPAAQRLSSGARSRALMPSAAPPGALSSTLHCVGAVPPPGGGSAAVIVANASDRAVKGTLRPVSDAGAAAPIPLEVPLLGSVHVPLDAAAPGRPLAAVVEVDGGEVAAELVVYTPGDIDTVTCASAPSSLWYFPAGSTAKDATLALSLFNPFPDDAIADLAFSTDQGRAVPADFQGIVVPGGRLVVVDVGSHVRRREAVATEVVVRSGRLVAAQTQHRTAPGRAGVSAMLGAPSTGTAWYFPDGLVADGLAERFAIANPNETEARVLVETALAEGVAEPVERTIPPRDRIDVILDESTGVPRGVAHAVTVRSLNDAEVVVSREVEAAPPSPRGGRAVTLGARRAAPVWLFPAGAATPALDEWVILLNPGTRTARVSLGALAGGQLVAVDGLGAVEVAPGRRVALRIGDHIKRDPLPFVVRASAPIVAERALYVVGRPGMSAAVGIPLAS